MHFHIFLKPFFTIKEKIFLFPFTEYFCRTVNKRFGAGMNTLMSIYDGLGPSIFCRKVEKARPMREKMDGRVVFFPARVGTPTYDAILFDSTFPYLYFDLAFKQLCFPPGKSINTRNESTTSELWRTWQNFLRAIRENIS